MTKATIAKLSVGDKVGRLTILEIIPTSGQPKDPLGKKRVRKKARCLCACGQEAVKDWSNLMFGHTRSCGCLQPDSMRRHDFSGAPEYTSWVGMKQRCSNKKTPRYKHYGGRGITVCDRWKDSFENFITDMGVKPTSTHSIDRTNNDGNYEPSNCRWATPKEQANNMGRASTGVVKKCASCGTTFKVSPSRVDKIKCCSRACRVSSNPEKICPACGVTFKVYPCNIKVTTCCSNKCRRSHNKKKEGTSDAG